MSKQKYFWFRIKVKVDSKQMQHICYPRVYVSGASLMWKQSNIYSMKSTFAELGSVLLTNRHNFTCFGRLLRYIFLFYSVECTPFGLCQPAELKQTIYIVIFVNISKLELQFVNNFTFSNTWTGQLQRCSLSAACDTAGEAWPGPHTGRCKTRGVSEK